MKRWWMVVFLGLLAILLAGCMAIFNKPPVPVFTWFPRQPYAGDLVTFDGRNSYDPDNDRIIEYLWDFGDGNKATGPLVHHIYQDNGVYSVTLTVKDRFGKKATLSKDILILNPPPEIRAIKIYDLNGYRYEAGDILRFCVEALDPAQLGINSIVKVRWDFGDGFVAYGTCVEHCFSRGCRYYTITVTVWDDDGDEATVQKEIFIYCKDRPPRAIIHFSPSEPHKNEAMVLDGRASYDNDRCFVPCNVSLNSSCRSCRPVCDGKERIISWKWEIFPPTGSSIVRWGSRIEFVPTQTGSYLIRLSVKDDEGNWATIVREIEVLP